ncbi:MAG TPA: patatin-like phospholipase family protein [Saprospiraceae bacterium]|nr:patatin-like phospholipase family protein [Saprospiraceae bacterium]
MAEVKLKKGQGIGLALGGGAVLGAAHIGAIRAIKEFDLEVEAISGTSIGAFIGALFSCGNDFSQIEDIALDLSWTDISGFSLSKFGLFSNDKIRDFLADVIGKEATFDDIGIPLFIVATNITSGEKKVLKSGDLADAVMASTCLPGIYKPIEIDGELYVDGGVVENVPISPLQEAGYSPIIAIDLNATQSYDRPGSMVDVLVNSFHFMMKTAAKEQTQDADILIQPDLSAFNYVDSSQTEELIKTGYEETRKVLEERMQSS